MKRKTLLALSVIPLTFLLSSCFALQGFWIAANQIEAGGKATKAVFEIPPGDLHERQRPPVLPGRRD